MPICPRCRDEYQEGVSRCASCDVALWPDDVDLPPRVDRLLGTFHPLLSERIRRLLDGRGIAHDAIEADGRVEIVVDREYRDDLRAELAVNWTQIVSRLEQDDMYTVLAEGGQQPGWYDAPEAAWVDREGRLQVDPGPDEEALEDASRMWGPSLVAIGAVVALFGWYGQRSAFLLVLGLILALVGLLLPR